MLSFEVEGGASAALELIDGLELITLTPTLGNLDSLVQHPWSMSHVVLPEERRLEMGIRPGIVRVSTGLEDAADLIADLGRALDVRE
jgi:cystathionine beta-lyase/cystathionine gamma-synthase